MAGPMAPSGPPRSSGPVASKAGSVNAEPIKITKGRQVIAHKTILYGPGGVGKSSLASHLSQLDRSVLFIDCEGSTAFLDVERFDAKDWKAIRTAVQMQRLAPTYDVLVIDSLTKAEELAVQYVLENVKHEKGKPIHGIEDYGWGKGYIHVYEEMLRLLADVDNLVRNGVSFVGICHDCVASVPNPGGEDYIRYEPRLQASKQGSIRHRVKEFCDHLLYIGFDTAVVDGKARGSGTRTIYPTEMPTHWAKSRKLVNPVPYLKDDPEIWKQIFSKEN